MLPCTFSLFRLAMATCMMGVAGSSHALVLLADDLLSDVAGRDGVSMVIDGGSWSIESVDFTQDGETLSLKGLSSRPVRGVSGLSTLKIDPLGERLGLSLSVPQTEYRVDDIALGSGTRTFGALRTVFQTDATLGITPLTQRTVDGPASISVVADSGFLLDGAVALSKGTAYVGYNGYELIARGVQLGASFSNAKFTLPSSGNDLNLEFSNTAITAGISGVSLDLAYGDAVTNASSRSFGALSVAANATGSISMSGGGVSGGGIRIKPDFSWSGGVFEYKDTGVIRSSDFSGSLSSTSGVTVDLGKDTMGSYIKFAASDLSVTTQFAKLVVGDAGNPKMGSVGLDLRFLDTAIKNNWLKLRPGGDVNAGAQGLTAQASWDLSNGSASVTDNGNSMWLSGLNSYGNATMTFDLTRACSTTTTVPGCYAGTLTDPSKGNYDGHFDGLRLGFSNVSGAYSLDGIRVGTSSSPLQGGTELLLLAGIYPAYDFSMRGQVTLLAGGKIGDGFRFNADLFLSNVNAAVSTDEFGKGIWLTGATQEMHYRNGSVDVSSTGLEINKGESWSKLDANNLRLGSKADGQSVGRLLLKTYERDSTLTLATGGAGALCVGAVAASATSCNAAGGRWEDRGDEGLSVKLKSIYVRDASAGATVNGIVLDEKRNQIALEARRSVGTDGKPINGTGVQVVLDNFWSSDSKVGDASANSYGVNAELGVDVAPTVVISKAPPFTQTSPLGFAVNGRVSFKEIGAERLQNVHPTGGAQTVLYGMRMQNADVRFNLTATPIN